MDSNSIQDSLAPIGDIASTAGYAASTATSVAKYLNDPLFLSKLSDRVYELLLEDLRSQRERVRNYGQSRWL